ncbi:MAG: peroxiredoxin [Candidatus Binatia bacterium]|nr:MAG: peroxiredoxin [Candidatus Binatia bacterium]
MTKLGTISLVGCLFIAAAVVRAASVPAVGSPAPDFQATSTAGPLSLKDLRGTWVVLYFYPKSFTPGCTAEASSLRDGFESLRNLRATVIGVSTDTLETQRDFKEKLSLPFELVADPDERVVKLYGVEGWLGMARRRTFIIDPQGIVRAVIEDVDTRKHAEQVRELIEKFAAAQPAP